jgi:DNA-binding NtrC family response regulator
MNKLVYFVDDDAVANQLFRRACDKIDLTCEVFDEAQHCLQQMKTTKPDIVLTDLNMPGMDGFELIRNIGQKWPSLPVIAVTGQSSVERAVKAMRAGACDFIRKPYELEELKTTINRNLQYADLAGHTDDMPQNNYGMTGASAEILRIFKMIDKLGMVDCPVVINGESGSGKELAARAIHSTGKRKGEPFVAIDCGSLPDTLLESELFGHVKGAFTGADQDRVGLLQAAGAGTIFLDEIGNISQAMQTKLLRVIQENVVTPVGSNDSIPIRARLICASNRDLATMVEAGEFRHDLYHRINVITLPVPSLSRRRDDIPLLVEQFIEEFSRKYELPVRHYSAKHMDRLCQLPWKGNVRELRNYVERCIILSEGETLDDVPFPDQQSEQCDELSGQFISLEELEKIHIKRVLKSVEGNQNKAARILGISRTTLWRKINEYT